MEINKPIRRSQLISPWGVGQMINFPNDESLMIAGLDMWFRSLTEIEEFRITEPRLSKRLGVKDFRLPPDFRKPGHGVINPSIYVPVVRFPQWHYCPRCGFMKSVSIYDSRKSTCEGYAFNSGRNCSTIPEKKRQKLIPVRFVAICPKGHIEDFPFMEWVHNGENLSGNHQLRLRAGRSSGTLSGIQITCSCGEKRTMAGAFNQNALSKINITCSGSRPWLGQTKNRNNTSHCGENLIVVQKGASNVYFSQVRSSIYLPQWEKSVDRRVIEILEKNWKFLTSGMENGDFQKMRFELVAERYTSEEKIEEFTEILLKSANQRLNRSDISDSDLDDSEEKYRKMEYDAILNESGSDNQDFYVSKIMSDSYSIKMLSEKFNSISLLHKLRETRAFAGFTRWLPNNDDNLESRRSFIQLGNSINWLPAIVVRGEGLFFEFDQKILKKWATNQIIINRAELLSHNYNVNRINNGVEERIITPEFILIHTFAHLIINQLSFECGYGSSALRERIYCSTNNTEDIMNGVLIYTASGDSEGSMGGLVRQGKPGYLETIVRNAIENSRWCSSDPICIESNGQGPNSCNLAACHNCSLLPETCCEESNKLLDRAMLIGTLENPSIGYFNI